MGVGRANAQYYSWGSSPTSVRWNRLETPDVKLIYPADYEENARRVLWYLDTVRTHIGFGFRHGAMRTPVVLHTQNMLGNGMVMWAPRRIEMLGAPGAGYSEPWLKQLAIHEYRHNVQYNNLRRGTNRVLTWLLGEQMAFLGVGQLSLFTVEGDATMAETESSAFGRGLQPSWTMHYRAMHNVGSREYSGDYWFCGSFREFIPDHYRLGYQLARWSYDYYDGFIWDDVARYVARNPQFIVPLNIKLKKDYGFDQTEMFRRAFADLNAYWESLPRVEETSARVETPWTSHTTYQWPLWLDEDTLVAFKSDLDRFNRIVRVDVATGREEVLAYTGAVSSRPVLSDDGVLWWTEYRSSTLWNERTNSRLCSYDFSADRKQVYRSYDQIFFPVAMPGSGFANVVYDYSGRFLIKKHSSIRPDECGFELAFPLSVEITGLAWDDVTNKLYFIGLDDSGMWLGSVKDDGSGYDRLTPSRHITVSDLRARDGKLYFGSIVSGRDEAHCYDIASGTEYRISTSRYGSFQPSPATDSRKIALTTYDRHGYHLAVQDRDEAAVQEQRTLPVDLVNPPWKRWDLPKMDSLVYEFTDGENEEAGSGLPAPKRYRKMLNLFRPHSWVPLDFYPPGAIQEADLTMNFGATVMSQSLLSDAVSWLSYGWSGRGGSMVRGGMSYGGLGPVLDVDFTWGGAPQTFYTPIPASTGLDTKKYFSVTTRLSLPMVLSSGYWFGRLAPSAEYFYTNGLIFRPYADWPRGELTRGVERLYFNLSYSGQTRMVQKEFLPRWGVTARTGYAMNPTNGDFRSLWSTSLGAWLPGIVRPHSTTLRMAWQETVGGNDAPFMFHMKEVFPRGARYDFATRRWASGSVDYQLPVWYPEGGWTRFIYFKRVRLNVFADYARWQDFAGKWRPLHSYGGDIILDISPLRMPATTNAAVKFTIAKPSDRRGVWFGFGLDLPL